MKMLHFSITIVWSFLLNSLDLLDNLLQWQQNAEIEE